MARDSRYTAIMWSLYAGKWHRINAARPAQDAKKLINTTIAAKPEVTNEDILVDLETRREYAKRHNSRAVYEVTFDGRTPPLPSVSKDN